MGSVWRFTHFLRAMGLMRPQKPSFDVLFNGLAVGEGCCCDVEGGLSCELVADCAYGPAGITIADASASTASWRGNKFRAALDLIKGCLFDLKRLRLHCWRSRSSLLARRDSNEPAKVHADGIKYVSGSFY